MNLTESDALGVNRRDFLKSSSFATLMSMLGGVQLMAQTNAPSAAPSKTQRPHVKVAVIGLGAWGREILDVLGRFPQVEGASVEPEVAAICDTYPAFVRRSATKVPKAAQTEDYKTILANKEIKSVIIATPTHQHKEVAMAALKAGKHVYCEAPLANTIEEAREIAQAARAAKKQVFQTGLQMRSDPQRHFLLPFIRSGALGRSVMARAQWHKKQSWRTSSPNAEREKALNWRLDKKLSLGLLGEIGMHQIDQAAWFLGAKPLSVSGYGSIALWRDDGRDVFDTVQAMFEFPNNVRLAYDATLANSFDADYEMYYGSDAAVMLRENKAWMFKEVDSPLLGWEVYARRDSFYRETGIALIVGGSKQNTLDQKATSEAALESTALFNSLQNFLRNSHQMTSTEEDFINSYGDDQALLLEHLAKEVKLDPAAGYLEGFQAAVIAIKANEAIVSGQKVTFQKEWFELG